ncbi:hypothetical protein [Bacillus sp. 7894-2]|uniref:phage tail protein n=1 Tax=Bacillus sp. 7894-2 TaxID=2021695 RepID=UPI000BA5E4B1|nr:hypothetical protein [Bacillus sp. 7894-2]PAE24080.1 hypothetical protein CHI10_14860 [Bacillus sp. 7894-2]
MAAKNNNKMNISYTIRAVDRFTDTHERLERQLEALERQAAALESVDPDINVDADTANAQNQLNATNNAVNRLPWYRKITIWVEQKGDIGRLATRLRNIDEILLQLGQGIIWALIPTLGPALAVAAGGAGALASQLVGAVVGLGAFAMVAVPAIKHLKDLDGEVKRGSAEWKKLSDGTRAALTSLDALRDTWSKMQDTFREPTLQVFASALNGANTALKMFQPTVEGSIKAMQNLADAFSANLGATDVKEIFEWLGTTAGHYLEDLMKTLGNFTVGLFNMFVAFDPLTQSFSDGFLKMSESFREWAANLENNTAWQRFLEYTAENGPKLLSFFGSFIQALTQIFIAMAPVGEKVLEVATNLFKWIDAFLEANPQAGKFLAYLILWRAALSIVGVAMVALFSTLGSFIGWVVKIWGWLGKLRTAIQGLGPWFTRIWGWLTRLGSVIASVLPWIGRIGMALIRFATGPIGLAITAVILIATVIYKNWDSIKTWTIDTFNKISAWIKTKWNEAKAVIEGVKYWVTTVVGAMGDMWRAVKDKMREIYDSIKTKWDEAKAFLEGIDLWSIGKNIIQGLVKGISSVDIGSAVSSVAGKIKSGFTNFFKIHSPSKLMNKDVGRWITLGVLDGVVSMASKAERQAEIVANAIKRPFDRMNKDYTFNANVAASRGAYTASRNTSYQQPTTPQGGGGLTQNLHFHGEAASSPAATARKQKQALRDFAMGANF